MKTTYKEGELLEFNEQGETKLFGLKYTEMVYVDKGTFNIGDNDSGIKNEKEATITFEEGYFIGKYPVTQEFYQYVTSNNPSNFEGKYRPVETVSWNDICTGDTCFLKQLDAQLKDKLPLLQHIGTFTLPSEAQWEYAARGGKAWDRLKLQFSGSNNIHDVGWFDKNSNSIIMPVGLKQPNILGLYDMSGNTFEWCMDTFTKDYKSIPKNGEPNQQSGTNHVLRGGYWYYRVQDCRVSDRAYRNQDDRNEYYGFRLVFSSV